MNILDLMPNFKTNEGDTNPTEAALDSEVRRRQRNHGPRPVTYLTNGQIRRAVERSQAAQKRKANRRFRRSWMANQRAVAVLRGQLGVLDKAALAPAEGSSYDVLYPQRVMHIVDDLTAKFGSVAAAREHFAAIEAEKVAA